MKGHLNIFVSVFLLFVFLFTTTGVIINSHQCDKNFSHRSISFFKQESGCEDNTGEALLGSEKSSCCTPNYSTRNNNDECCSTEHQFLKINLTYNLPLDRDEQLLQEHTLSNKNNVIQDVSLMKFIDDVPLFMNLPPPKIERNIIHFIQHQKAEPHPKSC